MTVVLFQRKAGLQFQGLVQYCHGGEHGDLQEDMVLDKELRVLHPDQQIARRESHWALLELLKPQSPLPMTQLLQQDYTYSNKVTCPNSFKYPNHHNVL